MNEFIKKRCNALNLEYAYFMIGVFSFKQNSSKKRKSKWKNYRDKCWEITNKQPLKKLKDFKNRGFKKYHLDHRISIWYGFNNGISPETIDNLKMIPYKDNMQKGIRCEGQMVLF